ncbi:MAG: hypothetical protein JJU00_18855 [Opitutales bacterium]|nr:hypothetical protein [Opitutales bacterium]
MEFDYEEVFHVESGHRLSYLIVEETRYADAAGASEAYTTERIRYWDFCEAEHSLKAGLPYAVTRPDQTREVYQYDRGEVSLPSDLRDYGEVEFTVASGGGFWRTRRTSGRAVADDNSVEPLREVDLVEHRSTMQEEIRDRGGRVVLERQFVWLDNDWKESGWTAFDYDHAGRLTARLSSNGLLYEAEYDAEGRLIEESHPDGRVYEHDYDGFGRRWMTVKRGKSGVAAGTDQVTVREFDATGKVVYEATGALETRTEYNLAGFKVRSHDVNNYGKEWEYDRDGSIYGIIDHVVERRFGDAHDGVEFNTSPQYESEVKTQYYMDGSLRRRWGSGVVDEQHFWVYDDVSERIRRESVFGHGTDMTSSASSWDLSGKRWERVERDGLGRVTLEESPGVSGTVARTFEYHGNGGDGAGKLKSIDTPGEPVWLKSYDSMGVLELEGNDVSGNGTLETTGSDDFVIEHKLEFIEDSSGGLWSVRRWSTFDDADRRLVIEDRSDFLHPFDLSALHTGAVVTSVADTRRDYLIDHWDEVPVMTAFVSNNRGEAQVWHNEVESVKDGSGHVPLRNRYSLEQNGYLTHEWTYANIHDDEGYAQWLYDGLGRLTRKTDPRGIHEHYVYYNGRTEIKEIRDHNYALLRELEHCGCGGQVSLEKIHDGEGPPRVIEYEYTPTGQLELRYGDTQPVEYEYNSLGQRTHMKRFGEGLGAAPTSVTKWDYHPNGWLHKIIDPQGRETVHAYEPGTGRVESITEPRDSGVDVTMHRHYDSATGRLEAVTYTQSSGSGIVAVTPDLEYEYDRLGRKSAVHHDYGAAYAATWGQSGIAARQTWMYSYEDNVSSVHYGRLGREQLPSMYAEVTGYSGLPVAMDHGYHDDTRRPEGRTLQFIVPAAPPFWESSWEYHADGRPSAVHAGSRTFDLEWLTGTGHLQEIRLDLPQGSHSSLERIRDLEATRNFLETEQMVRDTTDVVAGAHFPVRDLQGRARERELWGEPYGGFGNDHGFVTVWDYNNRGELIEEYSEELNGSVPLDDRYRKYVYDEAGNREEKHEVPDLVGKIEYTRAADGNQYEEIFAQQQWASYSRVFDVVADGPLPPDPDLEVHVASSGGDPFFLLGAYDVFLTGDGTSDLRFWTSFFNISGSNSSVSVRYFQNNMDGAYSHTAFPPKEREPKYDRAGNMTGDGYFTYVYDAANRLVEVSAGTYTWRFLYDPQGRRIRQELREDSTVRYDSMLVYDGPHPVREFVVDGDTLHPGRSFHWGPDISNTYGGAGGIGGLYMIRDGADDYAVGYDGLGNVSTLWHASGSDSGKLAATFEYDAYGQIVRETGAAHLTPFRYQSKWHLAAPVPDAGSGPPVPFDLYDYGRRWYHPDQGRFINRDPIGEAGGENLYAFVGNDPVNGRDFMGLCSFVEMVYVTKANGKIVDVRPDGYERIGDCSSLSGGALHAITEGSGAGGHLRDAPDKDEKKEENKDEEGWEPNKEDCDRLNQDWGRFYFAKPGDEFDSKEQAAIAGLFQLARKDEFDSLESGFGIHRGTRREGGFLGLFGGRNVDFYSFTRITTGGPSAWSPERLYNSYNPDFIRHRDEGTLVGWGHSHTRSNVFSYYVGGRTSSVTGEVAMYGDATAPDNHGSAYLIGNELRMLTIEPSHYPNTAINRQYGRMLEEYSQPIGNPVHGAPSPKTVARLRECEKAGYIGK